MPVHLLILLLSLLSESVAFITGFPFISAYDHLECLARECCKKAVHFDSSKLREDLRSRLHGQHIAEERLYSHAHMDDPNPRKALVLSLHGFTGVGKNFASSIIVSNILRKGEQSRFYHFYDSTIHFPHEDLVEDYKTELQSQIRKAVASCGVSIFVFDEVDKMPRGVLNALVPFLGFSNSIDGLDFRRSIFIFLGNSGGKIINEYLLEAVSQGKPRSSIQYGDVRRSLAKAVFNEKGAFELSNLISQHLITALVPFLPLQEVHVRRCIADAAARMQVEATEEMKDFIVDELDWGPNDKHTFSESGCKLVYEKVGFYLQHTALTKETDDDFIQADPHEP
ncbi:chaperone cofactor-dependent protein refolding [Sparganum proliferum]